MNEERSFFYTKRKDSAMKRSRKVKRHVKFITGHLARAKGCGNVPILIYDGAMQRKIPVIIQKARLFDNAVTISKGLGGFC